MTSVMSHSEVRDELWDMACDIHAGQPADMPSISDMVSDKQTAMVLLAAFNTLHQAVSAGQIQLADRMLWAIESALF